MKSYLIPLCFISIGTLVSTNPLISYSKGDDNICTAPGPKCVDCETTVMCIKSEDSFIAITQKCPDGYTCLGGGCTSVVNPACAYKDLEFPCQYEGAYPDPGDWTKYVFCSRNDDGKTFTAYPQNCEEGAAYDPLTTYCSKDLKNIEPTYFPVEPCMSQTQLPERLVLNPTIYFYCAPHGDKGVLYPFMRACPKGGIYENGECKINLKMKH